MKIDQEREETYGVETLFAQFLFAAARNPNVNRYIALEDIRQALKKGIGDKCGVDFVIDEYLKDEELQK